MPTETQNQWSSQALTVLRERYLAKDPETGEVIETPDQMVQRVAGCIANSDRLYRENEAQVHETARAFAAMIGENRFWPNSPTLMNAGKPGAPAQYSACFVIPIEDDMRSIGHAITAALLVHKSGGGTGFSFSALRPKGDRVRSSGGVASGPVSFAKIIDMATEQVKQGGTRRGANMGILDVSHPDLVEFLRCKAKDGEIRNFNLSVAVSDAFMDAVTADADWPLINPRTGQVVKTIRAGEIWEECIRQAHATGEPGFFFVDRANRDCPIPHVGRIRATNPCGEIPLHDWDACTLGSINLERHLTVLPDGRTDLDWTLLAQTVQAAVHFLDNVVDANDHPLPEITAMTRHTRRIGLGVMGLARVLFGKRLAYDSEKAVQEAEGIMQRIHTLAWQASEQLASWRGVYPAWTGSRHEQEGRKVRHSYVTAVAPTGTISMLAQTSAGIEPEFSLIWYKRVLDGKKIPYICEPFERLAKQEGWWQPDLLDKIAANQGSCRGVPGVPVHWQEAFATAHDIDPHWHVAMQAVCQKHVDAAVSKTVNLPHSATVHDVAVAYRTAWELGCKGITVYRDGSRKDQVLNIGELGHEKPPSNGNGTGSVHPIVLPVVLEATRVRIETAEGPVYVHVGTAEDQPVEVFVTTPADARNEEVYEAFARIFSLALQWGVPIKKLLTQLDRANQKYGSVATVPAAILRAFRLIQPATASGDQCPKCTGAVVMAEGCLVCLTCGWNKCS